MCFIIPYCPNSGKHHDIYPTGTTPSHIRIHIPYARNDQQLRLGLYLGLSQQRVDVYYNGDIHNIVLDPTTYRLPNNAETLPDGGLKYNQPSTPDEYKPSLTADSAVSGENFQAIEEGIVYVLAKGPGIIDIVTRPTLILSFNLPAMTADDFYSGNLIANLAVFLGIPSYKIKIVSVVSEGSKRRRRSARNGRVKRNTGVSVQLEISDDPTDDPTTEIGFTQMVTISNQLKTSIQTQEINSVLETEIGDVTMYDPVPPATGEYTEERQAYLEVNPVS